MKGFTVRNYLPSRTFVGIAVPLATGFCVALGLIYISYSAVSSAPQERGELLALTHQAILDERFGNLDTDGDGLEDWEEGLWGTNRNSTDTDGDGTSDNDEILGNRDPLVPGPHDSLSENASSSTPAATSSRDLTKDLAKSFFGPYLELKQTGQFNEANKQRLIGNVTRQTEVSFRPVTVSPQSLTTVPDMNLGTYAGAFDQALAPTLTLEDELAITHRALAEGESPSSLEETLLEHARIYNEAARTLTKMRVPEVLRDEHARLATILARQAEISRSLVGVHDDPVRGILMLRVMEESRQEAKEAMQGVLGYLLNNL